MYRGKINNKVIKKHKRKISNVGLGFVLMLNIDTRTFTLDEMVQLIRCVSDIIYVDDLKDVDHLDEDIKMIRGFDVVLSYILHVKQHHLYYRNEIYLSCCESVGQDTLFYFGECEY